MTKKLSKYQQKVLTYFQEKVALANKASDEYEFRALETVYLCDNEDFRRRAIAELDDRIRIYREHKEGSKEDWENSKKGIHLLSSHTNIKTLQILEAKGYLKIENMDIVDSVTLLQF